MSFIEMPHLPSNHRQQQQQAYMSGARNSTRDESYMLLLELGMQEPTVQACIKIVQSTCLAQGMQISIKGKKSSESFQSFINKYYIPFAEEAVRCFFVLGFVPWRLRKLASGDAAPECIPLGLFTWSIESMPTARNRQRNKRQRLLQDSHQSLLQTQDQLAAERSFQKQKSFFADTDKKEKNRFNPLSSSSKNTEKEAEEKPSAEQGSRHTPAYYRQKQAMQRLSLTMPGNGGAPMDDEESKLLRYTIAFTENCGLMEEEVEIYEFVPPSNNVTRTSVLYGSVPSPIAHILVDYRNMRHSQIMQSYADAYNMQAKFICSYKTQVSADKSSGDKFPAVAGQAQDDSYWDQVRGPPAADNRLPTEMGANLFTRDMLTEAMVANKEADHQPIVYTLPKNTTLENQQKLESILNIPQMQVTLLFIVSFSCKLFFDCVHKQIKFAKDVCSLMGIPYEMVSGGYDEMRSGEKKRTASNNKIFITNMMSLCR